MHSFLSINLRTVYLKGIFLPLSNPNCRFINPVNVHTRRWFLICSEQICLSSGSERATKSGATSKQAINE
jgi:hypothetical protein